MNLRSAMSGDGEDILGLIDSVLREYGDRIAIDGADADLIDIDSEYSAHGGDFVVLDDDGRIRGTHAVRPDQRHPGVCNFCRLYLDTNLRGGHWGGDLMQWALDWARTNGFERVELWSDSRFVRAHSFFLRFGFRHDGRWRDIADGATPYRERFFFMDL